MKISSRVEPLTRSAIHAAVQQDRSKLEMALQALPDDQATREAVELALAVTQLVLREIHQGKPSDEETRAVAAEIARAEAWGRATEEQISAFLLRLVNGEPFAGAVPTENVVVLAFVSAASLLSSCRRDDEEWWNYLDRVEAALEKA
ncbi:hypothetical protein ABZU25_05745 [Micromonospora sp. NPDC005215]|uniref:hypothetical protein n=1 Tax=Micromonospora sp. NPDC005215 TaxID=3157024 RepID=UPI0033B944EF